MFFYWYHRLGLLYNSLAISLCLLIKTVTCCQECKSLSMYTNLLSLRMDCLYQGSQSHPKNYAQHKTTPKGVKWFSVIKYQNSTFCHFTHPKPCPGVSARQLSPLIIFVVICDRPTTSDITGNMNIPSLRVETSLNFLTWPWSKSRLGMDFTALRTPYWTVHAFTGFAQNGNITVHNADLLICR